MADEREVQRRIIAGARRYIMALEHIIGDARAYLYELEMGSSVSRNENNRIESETARRLDQERQTQVPQKNTPKGAGPDQDAEETENDEG